MKFSNIILAYFVIGAVMWGGGAISWNDSGVAQLFVKNPSTGAINQNTSEALKQSGGPIQTAAGSFGGALPAIWNLLVKFIGFFFWPITVLLTANAPMRIVVLAGGSTVVAFLGAVLTIIRGST